MTNFLTVLPAVGRGVLDRSVSLRSSPRISVPWVVMRLDIVRLDLLVKPRVVDEPRSRSWARTARRSGANPPSKKQPEPGRRRRPAGTVRSCAHCSSGAGAEVLVAAVDSPCVLTLFPADGSRAACAKRDAARHSPPRRPPHQNCNADSPKVQGVSPMARRSSSSPTLR